MGIVKKILNRDSYLVKPDRALSRRKSGIVTALVASFIFSGISLNNAAIAAEVTLGGLITDGSFIAPAIVTNPDGSTTIEDIDQLRQTGTPLNIVLAFNENILGDDLFDGQSFMTFNASDSSQTGDVSVSGTFGDLAFNGFEFETQLQSSTNSVTFMDNILSFQLSLIGDNNDQPGPFLGIAQPFGVFTLSSPPVPQGVTTVGQLAEFLNMTTLLSSGTIPVEFFISTPSGATPLINASLPFEVSGTASSGIDATVPVPAAGVLFLSALFGGGAAFRRRKKIRP